MAKLTYKEQLLHPNWQRKRLEVFEAAGWACARCGETEVMLHAHHRLYRRGVMAWEYAADELTCLCSNCHSSEHKRGRPPAGSRSAQRDAWELLARFNVQACFEAADIPDVEVASDALEKRAREICAAAGHDYDELEALLGEDA